MPVSGDGENRFHLQLLELTTNWTAVVCQPNDAYAIHGKNPKNNANDSNDWQSQIYFVAKERKNETNNHIKDSAAQPNKSQTLKLGI